MGKLRYLAWPVTVLGKRFRSGGSEYHITLKFLGELGFNEKQVVRARMNQLGTDYPVFPYFKLSQFEQKTGPKPGPRLVLEALDFDSEIMTLHQKFLDIGPNDWPTFRPHITLDQPEWIMASQHGWQSLDIKIFPLRLMGGA